VLRSHGARIVSRRTVARVALAASLTACLAGSLLAARANGDDETPASNVESPFEWQGTVSAEHSLVASVLREARRTSTPAKELVEKLSAPNAKQLDAMLDILIQGRVPKVSDKDAPQMLSQAQRALLLQLIARFEARTALHALEGRLAERPQDAALRTAFVQVLGVLGTERDLARIDQLAPRAEDGAMPRNAAESARAAYVAILHRSPDMTELSDASIRRFGDAAMHELLLAIGDLCDPRAVPFLYVIAQDRPTLAQLAIAMVPACGRTDDADFNRAFALWLRDRVDPLRIDWTRTIVQALGVLDEGDAAGILVDLLSSEHHGLALSAHEALKKISGLEYAAQAPDWRAWFDGEERWFEREYPKQRHALRSSKTREVVHALHAFNERALHKSILAADVIDVLKRPEPALQALACGVLETLGTKRCIAPLVDLLASRDKRVADAAWRSLCKITSKDVPREPGPARAMLLPS
jgi:hypothetical protein